MSGAPIMFIVLFASHAFAPLSVSLEFVFRKGFIVLLFDLSVDVSAFCVTGETGVRVLHSPS